MIVIVFGEVTFPVLELVSLIVFLSDYYGNSGAFGF